MIVAPDFRSASQVEIPNFKQTLTDYALYLASFLKGN